MPAHRWSLEDRICTIEDAVGLAEERSGPRRRRRRSARPRRRRRRAPTPGRRRAPRRRRKRRRRRRRGDRAADAGAKTRRGGGGRPARATILGGRRAGRPRSASGACRRRSRVGPAEAARFGWKKTTARETVGASETMRAPPVTVSKEETERRQRQALEYARELAQPGPAKMAAKYDTVRDAATRARAAASAAFGEGRARRARATLTRVVRHPPPRQGENREAPTVAWDGKTRTPSVYISMGVDGDASTALYGSRPGHVAIAELLIAANAQINQRGYVRAPPPPRARRALSRSPSPSRERESARRPRAARVSGRAILSAARGRGAVRERTPPPPPRASRPPLCRRGPRAARAERDDPAVRGGRHGHPDVVRALLNAGADKPSRTTTARNHRRRERRRRLAA